MRRYRIELHATYEVTAENVASAYAVGKRIRSIGDVAGWSAARGRYRVDRISETRTLPRLAPAASNRSKSEE